MCAFSAMFGLASWPRSAAALEPAKEKVEVGAPAPSFALKAINPERSKVSYFALSTRVGEHAETPRSFVVLTFAASYCEPCRRELAALRGLASALAAADVELAVIVIDEDPEGVEAMRKLTVDELALPYPVLVDIDSILMRRYSANPLPYMVVIDRAGLVRAVRTGFNDTSLSELASTLRLRPTSTSTRAAEGRPEPKRSAATRRQVTGAKRRAGSVPKPSEP